MTEPKPCYDGGTCRNADLVEELNKRIQELEEAQRWIPFSECQPDDGEECLIETLCKLRGYEHTSVSYCEAYDSNVFVPGDWIKIRWAKVPQRLEADNG